jgi:mRNA interferase RelE/StbE
VTYRVEVASSAERELQALPSEAHGRLASALKRLADNPRPRGAIKLSQGRGWRLRVGDYRVLYVIEDEVRLVTVFAVGHRREVYRR